MNNYALANRTEDIKPQPMFKILDQAAKLELQGHEILHLEVGGTSGFINSKLIETIRKQPMEELMGYGPSSGSWRLRSLIAKHYSSEKKTSFSAENVAVGIANALIHQVVAVCCNPGEKIILPNPWFPTYRLAADYHGAISLPYALSEANNWQPDVNEIASLLKQHSGEVKLVFVNSPSNPLGSVIEPSIISEIIKLSAAHNAICVFDETYKELIYSQIKHCHDFFDNCIYLYSYSKSCAAAGLRLGSLVGPEQVIGKVNEFSNMFLSCLSPLLQNALCDYLELNEPFYPEILKEIPGRIEESLGYLSACKSISYNAPTAAFFLFINVSQLGMNGDEFSTRLLNEKHTCVCPGGSFGSVGKDYLRVSLGGPRAQTLEGVRRLCEFVKELE